MTRIVRVRYHVLYKEISLLFQVFWAGGGQVTQQVENSLPHNINNEI